MNAFFFTGFAPASCSCQRLHPTYRRERMNSRPPTSTSTSRNSQCRQDNNVRCTHCSLAAARFIPMPRAARFQLTNRLNRFVWLVVVFYTIACTYNTFTYCYTSHTTAYIIWTLSHRYSHLRPLPSHTASHVRNQHKEFYIYINAPHPHPHPHPHFPLPAFSCSHRLCDVVLLPLFVSWIVSCCVLCIVMILVRIFWYIRLHFYHVIFDHVYIIEQSQEPTDHLDCNLLIMSIWIVILCWWWVQETNYLLIYPNKYHHCHSHYNDKSWW